MDLEAGVGHEAKVGLLQVVSIWLDCLLLLRYRFPCRVLERATGWGHLELWDPITAVIALALLEILLEGQSDPAWPCCSFISASVQRELVEGLGTFHLSGSAGRE